MTKFYVRKIEFEGVHGAKKYFSYEDDPGYGLSICRNVKDSFTIGDAGDVFNSTEYFNLSASAVYTPLNISSNRIVQKQYLRRYIYFDEGDLNKLAIKAGSVGGTTSLRGNRHIDWTTGPDWSPANWEAFRDNCISCIDNGTFNTTPKADSYNLVIYFNQRLLNAPSGYDYLHNFVLFYEGNDPDADEVIEV